MTGGRRAGLSRRDAMVLLAAGASGYLTFDRFTRRQDTCYVSPDGSDWNRGTSPHAPYRTVQRAVSTVASGGEVRLLPGVYHERVHVRHGGNPGNPLLITADQPGTVTITWQASAGLPLAGAWRDEGDGIASAPVTHPVYFLREGDEHLFRVVAGGVERLRHFVRRPAAWSAFSLQDDRLYVFLRGQRHPRQAALVTHAEVPEPREWGEFKSANLWVEADHVAIHGIHFDFGIGAGIRIWDAEHVSVRDCSFTGCSIGVRTAQGRRPAPHVALEHCLYHHYPQHHWQQEWLNWREVYAAYASNGLIWSADPGTEVRDSVAVHCGDALRMTTFDQRSDQPVVVEGNWVALSTDDGLELDGDASDVQIRSNLFYRCHVALAASPVRVGPVVAERNVVADCQCFLKLVSPAQPDGSVATTRNVHVRHNLAAGGYPTYWSDRDSFEDCTVAGNVFAGMTEPWQGWPSGVKDQGNLWWRPPSDGEHRGDHAPPPGDIIQTVNALRDGPFDAASLMRAVVSRRAGPAWWPMEAHPATADLAAFVASARRPVA